MVAPKKPGRLRVFWNITKLRFMGPWWVRMWAPKQHKRWRMVLIVFHLRSMVTSLVTNLPMENTPDEVASDLRMHPGYVYAAVDVLVGRGFIKRVEYRQWPHGQIRSGYYATESGREAVASEKLIYEGYEQRGKVVIGTLKTVGLILGLLLTAVAVWRLLSGKEDTSTLPQPEVSTRTGVDTGNTKLDPPLVNDTELSRATNADTAGVESGIDSGSLQVVPPLDTAVMESLRVSP